MSEEFHDLWYLLSFVEKEFWSEVWCHPIMPTDKSWIHLNQNCPEYEAGLKKFIEKARLHVNKEGKIRCPCVQCYNGSWHKPDLVKLHCSLKGFSKM